MLGNLLQRKISVSSREMSIHLIKEIFIYMLYTILSDVNPKNFQSFLLEDHNKRKCCRLRLLSLVLSPLSKLGSISSLVLLLSSLLLPFCPCLTSSHGERPDPNKLLERWFFATFTKNPCLFNSDMVDKHCIPFRMPSAQFLKKVFRQVTLHTEATRNIMLESCF